jgi:hypothetical protein
MDRESDSTDVQRPWFGIAGWTKGDADILVYDKFDVWEIAANRLLGSWPLSRLLQVQARRHGGPWVRPRRVAANFGSRFGSMASASDTNGGVIDGVRHGSNTINP